MATKPFINASAWQQAARIFSSSRSVNPLYALPVGSANAPVMDSPAPHYRAEATAPA